MEAQTIVELLGGIWDESLTQDEAYRMARETRRHMRELRCTSGLHPHVRIRLEAEATYYDAHASKDEARLESLAHVALRLHKEMGQAGVDHLSRAQLRERVQSGEWELPLNYGNAFLPAGHPERFHSWVYARRRELCLEDET